MYSLEASRVSGSQNMHVYLNLVLHKFIIYQRELHVSHITYICQDLACSATMYQLHKNKDKCVTPRSFPKSMTCKRVDFEHTSVVYVHYN